MSVDTDSGKTGSSGAQQVNGQQLVTLGPNSLSHNRRIAPGTTYSSATNTATWPSGAQPTALEIDPLIPTNLSFPVGSLLGYAVVNAPNDATASAWLTDPGSSSTDVQYSAILMGQKTDILYDYPIPRADVLSLLTPVSPPAAPTVGSSAGGTLAAATYLTMVTYVTELGETTPSPASSLAVAVDYVLTVTSPPSVTTANGLLGYNVYSTTGAAGTETKQNSAPIPIGTNWTEPTTGLVAGATVPTANLSAALPILVRAN